MIFWDLVGAITEEELVDALTRFRNDREHHPAYPMLVDATKAKVGSVSGDAVRRLAPRRSGSPDRKIALVGATDAVYGMLRMYELYSERNCHVFRERSDAVAWLLETGDRAKSIGRTAFPGLADAAFPL